MNSFIVCLNAILPIFLVIATGYGSKRAGLIREQDVGAFNALVFKVFMPLMCFYNIYQSDLSSAVRPKLLIFTFLSILLLFLLALVYANRCVKEPRQRGVVVQGIFRSNYLILGVPITTSLMNGADMGVAAVLAAVVVPTFNVMAVIVLDLYNGKKPSVSGLVKDIAVNPLILGTFSGILALLLGLRLPAALESFVRSMSQAASPVMLFLLGAFFRFDGFRDQRRLLAVVCFSRLVLAPALTLGAAVALGFRGVELASLMSVFGSSNAVASFTMAQQMGGDSELAGNIVVLTSLFCSVTIFCWSFLFKSLGFF